MAPFPAPQKRYRCRVCGILLPGWLAWAQAPNGALWLGHLAQAHPDQVGAYLERMRGREPIGPIAAEAYDLIDMEEAPC